MSLNLNLNQCTWDFEAQAGRDRHGNTITVQQLVAALEGLQISVNTGTEKLNASNERVREQDQQINDLESGLNHALARLSKQNAA